MIEGRWREGVTRKGKHMSETWMKKRAIGRNGGTWMTGKTYFALLAGRTTRK